MGKLKRTISEPTPIYSRNNESKISEPIMNDMPAIIDDIDDIDDSWNFITEIVNENKIPDLPPEKTQNSKKNILSMKKLPEKGFDDDDKMEIGDDDKSKSKSKSNAKSMSNKDEDCKEKENDKNNEDKDEEMDEIVDVYTMMYQTMKSDQQNIDQKQTKTITFDDDDDDNKDSMEGDDIGINIKTLNTIISDSKSNENENDDLGPNISFADLSDF